MFAFSSTSTNKSQAFALWKFPLVGGFLTMLSRSGFSSEAVCIARAERKLAPWLRLALVCEGVCSVFISRRPSAKSSKKSLPSRGEFVWFPVDVSGPGGHCSGRHWVFCSVNRCNALDAAWAFGKNSKVLKVPPFVISVTVAPLRAPALSYCGIAFRTSPSVLELYCILVADCSRCVVFRCLVISSTIPFI